MSSLPEHGCSDLHVDSIAVKIRTKATIQTSNGSQVNVIINGLKKSYHPTLLGFLGGKNGEEDNKHAENLC